MEQKKTNPNNGLRALIDELYALASKKVASVIASVTGSFPIVITGTPGNPNVTIAPATDLSAGSLSAADKAKLDSLTPGSVTAVTGVAPITSTGGTTPAIGITPATDIAAGSMSASDKAKLDAITPGGNGTTATVTSANSPYNIGPTDTLIEFDESNGALATANFPPGPTIGRRITFKWWNWTIASPPPVINGNGAQVESWTNPLGAQGLGPSTTISTQGGQGNWQYDGTRWVLVSV